MVSNMLNSFFFFFFFFFLVGFLDLHKQNYPMNIRAKFPCFRRRKKKKKKKKKTISIFSYAKLCSHGDQTRISDNQNHKLHK